MVALLIVPAIAAPDSPTGRAACRAEARALAARTDPTWTEAIDSGGRCAGHRLRRVPGGLDVHGVREAHDDADRQLSERIGALERLALVEVAAGMVAPGVQDVVMAARRARAEGALREADRLSATAVDAAVRLLPPGDVETGWAWNTRGLVLADLGEYLDAVAAYEAARPILVGRFGTDDPWAVRPFNNLGVLYAELGHFDAAARLHEEVLRVREAAWPDTSNEACNVALTLVNLARVELARGRADAALARLERAVPIYLALHGPADPDTASARSLLAEALVAAGRAGEALPVAEEVVAARREAQGEAHPDTAVALARLAHVRRAVGDLAGARTVAVEAVAIAAVSEDVNARRVAFVEAMDAAAANHGDTEAVLWGKLAVAALQDDRADLDASRELSEAFVAYHEPVYRRLADALARLGRIHEAQEVLALLKDREQRRFEVRGGAPGAPVLDPVEETAFDVYRTAAARAVSAAMEFRTLRKRAALDPLGPSDEDRLRQVGEQVAAARLAADAAHTSLVRALTAAGRGSTAGELGLARAGRLGAALGRRPETAALHVVMLPDHLTLLLTTADVRVTEQVEVSPGQVAGLVLALRTALADPTSDPRPAAEALYDLVVAPVEDALAAARARTLLVWLDGPLRYVPMAALWDGEGWLVERFETAVYTAASEADLTRPPVGDRHVAAFGATAGGEVGGERFGPLPGVAREIDAIVRDAPSDPGAAPGVARLDATFTRAALSDALVLGAPWIHVATHFRFRPGTDADSFLLLGDGTALTVRDLRLGDFPLAGVDLVTLSACDTALGGEGAEVEGLAVVVQNQGAANVIASLWPVADASTAAWMERLYAVRATKPDLAVAAAVREVQLAFLRGEIAPTTGSGDRGLVPAGGVGVPPPDWSHPYFWAPFVPYGAGG